MNKTILKSMLAVIAVAMIGVGSTWAYLTYMQSVNNTFTVGTNKITVTEEFDPPKELEVGDNIFKKKVQIENTGTVSCYIRVFAEFSNSDIKKISSMTSDGTTYYSAEEYPNHLPDGWVYISETESAQLGGYYYYTKIVEPGKKTVPLFERVKTHFDTAEQIVDYDIIVYSESVQILDKNGAEFTGDDAYKKAWTEFLELR